jgi:alpha-ketoglutaric semialdehyde dehydrogenase
MTFSGKSLIGFREASGSDSSFSAWNPATGQKIEPTFYAATTKEADNAVRLAASAFPAYSSISHNARASFLRRIATRIEAITDELVERAHLETALPKPRLISETGRTCGQLRLFANVVEENSWVGARIDRADPNRKPLAKPDVRSMLHPIGPVVVFGASNFPLAFSVAGGDTASALAAGNPVIFKAHAAHPGTSELVARAIIESIREENLPEGVFSLLFDSGNAVGAQLAQHPLVRAGGFTGSTAGGRALMNLAAARPEPIPFYAEMGSSNPVFLLPGALASRGKEIAGQLHGSFTLGSGQFCTKPGLVFVPQSDEASAFVSEIRDKSAQSQRFTLLTGGISSAYRREIDHRKKSNAGIAVLAEGEQPAAEPAFLAGAVVFQTDAKTFAANPDLAAEVFGPSTLLIQCSSREQIIDAARNFGGHLTATILGTEKDLEDFADLVEILKSKVGRIVFNGYPTGVEVNHAMVHGGPYPASSDSRTTSVGTMAILRFARPVCYQDFPDAALPDALKSANPHGIWRMIDGELTRQPL